MIDLELRRKALAADGWQFGQVASDAPLGYSWRACPERSSDLAYGISERTLEAVLIQLPAVEHDPGVSENWFLAICQRNAWHAEMEYRIDGTAVCKLWKSRVDLIEIKGNDPSDARAKAVVAASKGEVCLT